MAGTIDNGSDTAGTIRVRALALDYPVYRHLLLDRARTLLGAVWPLLRPESRRVLDQVSFAIAPGEVVGIVGMNGAGKTSLLKIIAGLLRPASGSAAVGGRVMALLAMGIGFRPQFTGRENARYGGLLFGLTPGEIDAILPAVAEFSELGDALDQPYFTYSSGMRSRLAFALVAHIPADIFILDETLAVGDGQFVTKCYRRLRQLQQSGKTILFVSHNLGEIARLTQRVIVLDRGAVIHDGDVFQGLRTYETILADRLVAGAGADTQYGDVTPEVVVRDAHGDAITHVEVGQPVTVELRIASRVEWGESFVVLRIADVVRGQLCTYLMPARWQALAREGGTGNDNVAIGCGDTLVRWQIPHWVSGEGAYSIDVYLGPRSSIAEVDLTRGRFWTAVARLAVGYGNSYLRGAGTTMEMPVAQVEIRQGAPAASVRPSGAAARGLA
jgi:ABC-type polysaccharide/polyol phosphate transport system ATPase subunit